MNTTAIGTQIPTATAHTIETIEGINAIVAHRLTVKWAKETAKGATKTKAWAAEIAEMLVTNPDADDLGSLTKWLAANAN